MRFNTPRPKNQSMEMTPEFQLYLLACSDAMFGDRLNSERARIQDLVKRVAPEYTAKLASYSRRELNNRAAAAMLTAQLVRQHGGEWARAAVFNVVQRADEFGELVAAVDSISRPKMVSAGVHEKRKLAIPASLKKGLAAVFQSGRFDEFQYSKWNKPNTEVKLRDAFRLAHPKPMNDKQAQLFRKIDRNELAKAETHERKIGKIRSEVKDETERKELEKQSWSELLGRKKLSHIALIREAKHILQTDPELLELYLEEFKRTAVKSNTFPHSYVPMIKEVLDTNFLTPIKTRKFVEAVQDVMKTRAERISSLFGSRLVIAMDVSGSMHCSVSPRSVINRIDVALTMGCSLLANGHHRGLVFSDGAKFVPPITQDLFNGINMAGNLIPNGCTNFFAATELIRGINPSHYDAVLVLTDMGFNSGLRQLEEKLTSNVQGKPVYFVDLAGSMSHPIEFRGNCYFLAGLSDTSLHMLSKLRGNISVIDEIMKYPLLKEIKR